MPNNPLIRPPSVDSLLRLAELDQLIRDWGRPAVRNVVRDHQAKQRELRSFRDDPPAGLAAQLEMRLIQRGGRGPRPVFNLTGTVLHTNLGRAVLPRVAADAVHASALAPVDLEFRLADGARGKRDDHVRALLRDLTGAEDAIIVNNNAAAILLILNTLALSKEVPVSRGELIEIGGSFRLPEIMLRSGCRLREVGTTNRTHLDDYAEAISPETGLLMKVHRSNYQITGFTAEVAESALAELAHQHNLPFAVDLGSGSLLRLEDYGLPAEPTPMQALSQGADLVCFSGDKLLGGPQAGIIVGSRHWIDQLDRNPLKRALRVDKLTLAALAEVLKLLTRPDELPAALPVLRDLTRKPEDIRAQAKRILVPLQAALPDCELSCIELNSQVGSGAMPGREIASAGLRLVPGENNGAADLAARLRHLPRPVIGRVREGALLLDLRCLNEEDSFIEQLGPLSNGAA